MSTGSTSTCKQRCDDGYTTNGDTNKICTPCDVSCKTCADSGATGDRYKCLTCSANYKYKYQ